MISFKNFKSVQNPMFRIPYSESTFNQKYRHEGALTWAELSKTLIDDVCGDRMTPEEKERLIQYHTDLKFVAGGRYLYYAGRPKKFFNNCYLLRALEDTREDWADLSKRAETCLATGGGIGVDYSIYRASGSILRGTGGIASGPISKMRMINEIGREIMQGGSRRSAIYASLNWQHGDIKHFLHCKDWANMPIGAQKLADGSPYTLWHAKQEDFNFHAPLDMTNVSVNYDTKWLMNYWQTGDVGEIFTDNVRQALSSGEPGLSFNFFDKENETLRNAPVAGDTDVLTNKGHRKVRDIVDCPTTVWTGKQWADTTFKKTKESTDTVKVSFSGGRSITCDPSHEFFVDVYSGKGKTRKYISTKKLPAHELNAGDILKVSLPNYDSLPFEPSSYTLGYMYGDGHFRQSGGGEISLCTNESKDCLKYMDARLFSSVTKEDSRGFTRCYVKTSATPHRSKSVFLNDLATPSFIAGLFDADGSFDVKQNRYRLASVHKEFLEGVQRYLEELGILSSIVKGGKSTYGQKDGWLLCVMADYVTRFSYMIPCKRLPLINYAPYRKSTIKVLKIEEGKPQDVYCCDVGVEEHSFQANGIIISNCCEVTSEDDSDVCNLGSINLSRIESMAELADVVNLSTKFLLCGTLVADLPYAKVQEVREKNRRLGLGLMGVHEWLIQRGYQYEVVPELHKWLTIYRDVSRATANTFADKLGVSRPVACRSIAPTGSIGILAGTTTSAEPLFAVAYKRRYLKGTKWHYQYVVDGTAQHLINVYGKDPDTFDTSYSLALNPEQRIKFQADIQDYVDMAISSTINLPKWGSKYNNEDTVKSFAGTLASYASRLRGFTCYPDSSRGGQPLTPVPYREALEHLGTEFEESIEMHDICDISGKGGVCGS